MKIYDISQEVFSCKVFPGDPAPQRDIAQPASTESILREFPRRLSTNMIIKFPKIIMKVRTQSEKLKIRELCKGGRRYYCGL